MKKLLSLSLFAAVALFFASSVSAQVVVIANNSVKASAASPSEIEQVFTGGASRLKDGSRVVPVLLRGGPVQNEFLAAYITKSDAVFRSNWRSLVFSGQATMPKAVETEAAMVEYVAKNADAIGYVSKATPHDGVKVLSTK